MESQQYSVNWESLTRILSILACGFFLLTERCFAQQKFDPAELRKPAMHGEEVAAQLGLEEVYEYAMDGQGNRVFLKNGFRTSRFPNKESWLNIRDTVEPYRVDIVYSRYPVRNREYHEIYPLL